MFDTVLYHKSCADGNCCLWIFQQYMKENDIPYESVKFYPMEAGKFIDIDYTNKNILMMDVSFLRENLRKVAEVASKITILDHHKTSFEQIEDKDLPNLELVLDMERSGCQITWDYFFPGVPRKWFIELISDMDLWKFEYPDTKAYSNAVQKSNLYGTDGLDKINSFTEEEKESFLTEGRILCERYDKYVDYLSTFYKLKKFKSLGKVYTAALFICASEMRSSVGNRIVCTVDCDLAIHYEYLTETDEWKLSGRAVKDDIDLTHMFLEYGGGGHKHASGFRVSGFEKIHDVFTD